MNCKIKRERERVIEIAEKNVEILFTRAAAKSNLEWRASTNTSLIEFASESISELLRLVPEQDIVDLISMVILQQYSEGVIYETVKNEDVDGTKKSDNSVTKKKRNNASTIHNTSGSALKKKWTIEKGNNGSTFPKKKIQKRTPPHYSFLHEIVDVVATNFSQISIDDNKNDTGNSTKQIPDRKVRVQKRCAFTKTIVLKNQTSDIRLLVELLLFTDRVESRNSTRLQSKTAAAGVEQFEDDDALLINPNIHYIIHFPVNFPHDVKSTPCALLLIALKHLYPRNICLLAAPTSAVISNTIDPLSIIPSELSTITHQSMAEFASYLPRAVLLNDEIFVSSGGGKCLEGFENSTISGSIENDSKIIATNDKDPGTNKISKAISPFVVQMGKNQGDRATADIPAGAKIPLIPENSTFSEFLFEGRPVRDLNPAFVKKVNDSDSIACGRKCKLSSHRVSVRASMSARKSLLQIIEERNSESGSSRRSSNVLTFEKTESSYTPSYEDSNSTKLVDEGAALHIQGTHVEKIGSTLKSAVVVCENASKNKGITIKDAQINKEYGKENTNGCVCFDPNALNGDRILIRTHANSDKKTLDRNMGKTTFGPRTLSFLTIADTVIERKSDLYNNYDVNIHHGCFLVVPHQRFNEFSFNSTNITKQSSEHTNCRETEKRQNLQPRLVSFTYQIDNSTISSNPQFALTGQIDLLTAFLLENIYAEKIAEAVASQNLARRVSIASVLDLGTMFSQGTGTNNIENDKNNRPSSHDFLTGLFDKQDATHKTTTLQIHHILIDIKHY